MCRQSQAKSPEGLTVRTMRHVIAWMIALLVTACGGGGAEVAGTNGVGTPTIRFEGAYDVAATRTLTIRPVAGASMIGSNALARVDVLVNEQLTLTLTEPNGTASEPAAYVFGIPAIFLGEAGPRFCTSNLPLRITAVDVTGFSFTKWVTVCPVISQTFSAFSDYGEHDVRITASSSAPVNALVQRRQEVGTYRDDVLRRLTTSLDVMLRSGERDSLTATIGTFGVDPAAAPTVPDGSTTTMRIDAGGGAFAEATSIGVSDSLSSGQSYSVATLACCRAVADGSAKQVRIIISGSRWTSPSTFAYAWRITDPASGTVVSQESGTRVGVPLGQSGSTLARLEQVLDVRSGQQVEVTATTDDPHTRLDAGVFAGATTGLALGDAGGNRQVRVSVFCCSLYASP